MEIQRHNSSDNGADRHDWVKSALFELRESFKHEQPTLIDIGAGEGIYRETIESLGFEYFAHDFGGYSATNATTGIRDSKWDYTTLTYSCDILELPLEKTFDVVICTEVLEHVPDPVASLKHISKLVKNDGYLLITVPMMSFVHQEPYYFSSGLSTYWFEYWIPRVSMDIEKLIVQGDYVDFMRQEIERIFYEIVPSKFPNRKGIRNFPYRLGEIIPAMTDRLRRNLNKELLESAGFGTWCIARSPRQSIYKSAE